MRIRRVMRATLLASALVAVAGGATAQAGATLQFRSHIDATFLEPGLSAACGFPIAVHLVGTDHLAVFFDQTGALLQVIETTPGFTHTFINVATGTSYTTVSPAVLHITVNADGTILLAVDGLFGHIFVNGKLVSVRTGRTVWPAAIVGPGDIEPIGPPIFQAGPLDPPVPALCAALA